MKNKFYPFIAIIAIWFLFASPFFIKGKVAFPSAYQVNSFSPWSTYSDLAGPIKNNAQPDIITQIYPWRYFDIQELKKGRIAFWNPYSFGGTPHLANYQSAVLFPLNILFFLPFSFPDIWSFLVVLQPLFAGIFMYLFMRKIGVFWAGSLLSSFSFMFCGFLVTWMGYATLGYAILPLPLALFAIEQYTSKKHHKWLILLSITFLFSFFAGHFQTSLYFSLGIGLFIIYNLIYSKEKKPYLEAFLFSVFGLLLSMPQILPSIELYTLSVRSNLFQKVEAIPISYLPTLLSPDFYGNPVTRNDWFGHYAEWSGYSGAIPVSFAIFALFKKNSRTYFFIFLAIVSILLAYDSPILSGIILLKVPVISTSSASRIIVLFSFSIAALAGFGLESLSYQISKNRKIIVIWICAILIAMLTIGAVAFGHLLSDQKANIAQKNLILPLGLMSALIISTLFLFVKKAPKYIKIYLVIILLLAGFEMYRFASKWQSFDSPEQVFKEVPTTQYYSQNFGAERFYGDFTAENAVYYRLPTLTGYDPLYPSRFGEFMKAVNTGKIEPGDRSAVVFPKFGKYTPLMIDFLGIKYFSHKISDAQAPWEFPYNKYPLPTFTKIYDDLHYQIFRNNNAFDRAIIVSNVTQINQPQEIVNYLFSNNLKSTAVIEEKIDGIDQNVSGKARITNYSPTQVTIEANASGRALMVLTDNFYPGWKVLVNGVRENIYRTDYTFRGVIIPKGKSTITFSYFPSSFLIGIYLALVGILGIVMSIIFKAFQSKK